MGLSQLGRVSPSEQLRCLQQVVRSSRYGYSPPVRLAQPSWHVPIMQSWPAGQPCRGSASNITTAVRDLMRCADAECVHGAAATRSMDSPRSRVVRTQKPLWRTWLATPGPSARSCAQSSCVDGSIAGGNIASAAAATAGFWLPAAG
eukprot:CAMPEP_0172864594 /NCGR_PEP_ID=MMETSP1075-20121228/80733_1 /TAXON_ID=2916 /ORGANISM="Ceratium fusus, Strain PA161109" /LENGTH=146 /DNA_ID=CAMNT_0013713525 /DNA_START=423 /DNA_END=859 /DNA_ORIENTATION=+